MNRKVLFALWGGLYVLCAGLGFIPQSAGAVRVLLMLLSVGCFVPPLLLIRTGNRRTVKLVRNLSALWLLLTVTLIIGNFLTLNASYLAGNILYCLLVIVSSPMICGQIWVMSLFGWSYLLFDSIHALGKH